MSAGNLIPFSLTGGAISLRHLALTMLVILLVAVWPATELHAEPPFDGVDVSAGWAWSYWFGWFVDYTSGQTGWVYHTKHGWLYVSPASGSGYVFYRDNINTFFWTNSRCYPWMYRYAADWQYFMNELWVYYMGDKDDAWFGVQWIGTDHGDLLIRCQQPSMSSLYNIYRHSKLSNSIAKGSCENDRDILFLERWGRYVSQYSPDCFCDILEDGYYYGASDGRIPYRAISFNARGSMDNSTFVDVYLLHIDRVEDTYYTTASGSVNFPGNILGIQLRESTLDGGDLDFKMSDVAYPNASQSTGRGAMDKFSFIYMSRNHFQYSVDLDPGDFCQMRIFVETGIPLD